MSAGGVPVRILKYLLLASLALPAAAYAETRIAVVDLGAAIFGTELARQRQEELKKKPEYNQLQAKYDSTAAELKALQKKAEEQGMTWSEEQKADYAKQAEYLRADLELTARKLESEVRALQGGIVRELQPKALEALQELVEQEGIDLLLRADAVLLAKPELNLTARLTERLNQKAKGR